MQISHKLIQITFLLFLILPDLVWAQTVAILEFKDESSPASVIAPTTIRKLFTDLFPPEEFTLIDRDLIQKILPPTTQEAIGEITPSIAQILGQILGADILVIGSYREISGGTPMAGSLFIEASFIDTRRSQLGGIGRQIVDLFSANFTREGLVEAVTNKTIILNIGSFHGVQIGDRFIVKRGEYLVGEVQVSRVEKYMSEALLVSGDSAVHVGDMVYRRPVGPVIPLPRRILIVNSTPVGARFNLNGIPRGITPLVIYEPDIKIHTIDLLKEGYSNFTEEIIIEERPFSFLDVNLVLARLQPKGYIPSAKESSIIVSSIPSNAKVYLNGELKGVTPMTLSGLSSGLFKVRVAKAGYGSIEQEVVLKEQEVRRLNINLEPILMFETKPAPARPIPLPPELFQVQTPYAQDKGGFYIALKYPELFAFRTGIFLDGLELRLQGLGLGVKYQFKKMKQVAFDLHYRLYDFRHNKEEKVLDLRGIIGIPFDSGFGLWNLTGGAGCRSISNRRFHFFSGLDSYLTPRLKLLAEYDNLDGFAAGLRYDLPKDIKFAIGGGSEPDGTFRGDACLSFQR